MNPIVPRSFPCETVVILAGGPSLTKAQVDAVRGRARVIAVKDAVQLAPWADVLYACDAKWWRHYGDTVGFAGPKYALEAAAAKWATVLRNAGELGLELDPTGLRTGRCSGYQAINLAVHLGAARIILLGYDAKPSADGRRNWFGERPRSYWLALPAYDQRILQCWPTIVQPLAALGVDVLNATPGSALDIFPRVSLDDALQQVAA